jgi:hypothetical protein
VEAEVATLTEEYQIAHGAVGFVPINVMHTPNHWGAILLFGIQGEVAPFQKAHTTLLTTVMGTMGHTQLDDAPLPQVGVFTRGG